jgi:tetratricopeptide (TPR) repeat protein
LAAALHNWALVAQYQLDYAAARQRFQTSLEIERTFADARSIGISLTGLGEVAAVQGDWEAARACLEESLALQRSVGAKHSIANALENLAFVAWSRGDLVGGRTYLTRRWTCIALSTTN